MADDRTPQNPEWVTCPDCGGTYLAGFACVACREGYGVPQLTRPTSAEPKRVPALSVNDARFLLASSVIIFFTVLGCAILLAVFSVGSVVPEDGHVEKTLVMIGYGLFGVIALVFVADKVRAFRARPGRSVWQDIRHFSIGEALDVLGLSMRWRSLARWALRVVLGMLAVGFVANLFD